MARDEQIAYHVEFVRRKRKPGPGEFASIFVWDMHFAPKQTKTLRVQYRIPISMGLVTLEKQGNVSSTSGALGQDLLNTGELEVAGYITSTGSSWAGNVEAATFRLITAPFERYLNYRGFSEETATRTTFEELKQANPSFPVRHPWWFREITPAGWEPVEGGVKWQYKNFKPKDPIGVRYYITQFPRIPVETDAFVDAFLKGLQPNDSPVTELGRVKQVLLATYGKQPDDPVARAFASEQLWYKPNSDFSLDRLNAPQKAILKRIDYRIAKLREK
ncbi:MAG TPA: hypothetical protein VMF66_12505 [Candidatus Acidoferrum sp.]|nr:hypothetical protein [Candidatus Acidoferrum sp.]